MLAPILAAIIIILLIIYAAYPLLISKEFHGWANIALTVLILFTVIVVLFVILGHQKGNRLHFKTIPTIHEETSLDKTQEEVKEQTPLQEEEKTPTQVDNNLSAATQETKTNPEEISDEEALMLIAKEYVEAEEAFKAQGDADYQQKAAQQIIDRYDFTHEDWQTFLEDAARYDLFNKAKAEIK
ncbi:MAG: hypothetical protein II972_00535 [Elusimicrobiaceae bacterium]|nr:hypothetical protein [Elusimicrobiaceae bacterium]